MKQLFFHRQHSLAALTNGYLYNRLKIRANKEHYNAMAAVIAKEKDRTETTRELERAERGMVELQSRREALARRIEQHHRQFQVRHLPYL